MNDDEDGDAQQNQGHKGVKQALNQIGAITHKTEAERELASHEMPVPFRLSFLFFNKEPLFKMERCVEVGV